MSKTLSMVSAAALLMMTASAGASPERQVADAHLIELLSHKQYLQLTVALSERPNDSSADMRFVDGVFANTRNEITQSIAYLKPLLSSTASKLTIEKETVGFRTLADDYAKGFRYADAADTLSALLQRLGSALSPAMRTDIESDRSTFDLLRNTPAQTARIAGTFDVATKRDAIGELEAPIAINGRTESWILDTGANISLLIRSRAESLGLTLSAGTTPVTVFSGKTVPCHMSVIPRLTIGKAEVRNVAVLVMEDKDYYIPQIHFQLEAVLGYPVLSALGRITFYSDGHLRVDTPGKSDLRAASPIFMDGLTPVVAGDDGVATRLFTFDTGAANTILTEKYLNDHRAEFATQQESTVEMAAHPHALRAFHAKRATLTIDGVAVNLQNAPVLAEPLGTGWDYYFGNLGQDVLRQFRSYTIDFRSMRFSAEGDSRRSPRGIRGRIRN